MRLEKSMPILNLDIDWKDMNLNDNFAFYRDSYGARRTACLTNIIYPNILWYNTW